MRLPEVRQRVRKIMELEHDPEAAHARLDDLWEYLLKEISLGVRIDRSVAREALRPVTGESTITRWYS